MVLKLSSLPKTWIIDLDGTILKHNGYKEGKDELLKGVKEFFNIIPTEDTIIILTSRETKYTDQTINFLKQNKIRYDHIIFDIPYGERILINDKKETGLITAYAINKERNSPFDINFEIDEDL
ncbi:hypothetical protein X927_03205 [Petrotoga mexicana DSM 14811]|uniref:FCP1 homology domain-containing protein n=1 Tax=Petrotoga mexicana DSM 14811 TaxID=1122954 RepID=A0A2K1PCG7_9BACT|nr:hypothetical protein [Petrotoga mexicana]PNS00480.1 hypothetical protein X927_03205 [Petrotoga mexicana DSM 14811]